MNRRAFLSASAIGAAATWLGPRAGAQSLFDVIIQNGTLVDGTGDLPVQLDLGIVGDTIAAVDRLHEARGRVTRVDRNGFFCAALTEVVRVRADEGSRRSVRGVVISFRVTLGLTMHCVSLGAWAWVLRTGNLWCCDVVLLWCCGVVFLRRFAHASARGNASSIYLVRRYCANWVGFGL